VGRIFSIRKYYSDHCVLPSTFYFIDFGAKNLPRANLAFSYALGCFRIVSYRLGETTDDFIADLIVGLRTGYLKIGSPARGERAVKYNRIMNSRMSLRLRGQM
jgi:hypothetical protein